MFIHMITGKYEGWTSLKSNIWLTWINWQEAAWKVIKLNWNMMTNNFNSIIQNYKYRCIHVNSAVIFFLPWLRSMAVTTRSWPLNSCKQLGFPRFHILTDLSLDALNILSQVFPCWIWINTCICSTNVFND